MICKQPSKGSSSLSQNIAKPFPIKKKTQAMKQLSGIQASYEVWKLIMPILIFCCSSSIVILNTSFPHNTFLSSSLEKQSPQERNLCQNFKPVMFQLHLHQFPLRQYSTIMLLESRSDLILHPHEHFHYDIRNYQFLLRGKAKVDINVTISYNFVESF